MHDVRRDTQVTAPNSNSGKKINRKKKDKEKKWNTLLRAPCLGIATLGGERKHEEVGGHFVSKVEDAHWWATTMYTTHAPVCPCARTDGPTDRRTDGWTDRVSAATRNASENNTKPRRNTHACSLKPGRCRRWMRPRRAETTVVPALAVAAQLLWSTRGGAKRNASPGPSPQKNVRGSVRSE